MAFRQTARIARCHGRTSRRRTHEAEAIRWAVDVGARVIHCRSGACGTFNPGRHFSGRGQCDQTSRQPRGRPRWRRSRTPMTHRSRLAFAQLSAALPHVLGVSALSPPATCRSSPTATHLQRHLGAGPGDLLHPAAALNGNAPALQNQGYSDCGPDIPDAAGCHCGGRQLRRGRASPCCADPHVTAACRTVWAAVGIPLVLAERARCRQRRGRVSRSPGPAPRCRW